MLKTPLMMLYNKDTAEVDLIEAMEIEKEIKKIPTKVYLKWHRKPGYIGSHKPVQTGFKNHSRERKFMWDGKRFTTKNI